MQVPDFDRLNRLTEVIIRLCIDVHRELGPGLLESVYEECLALLLTENGISYQRQGLIPIRFRGKEVGNGFRYDLLVESAVLIEIKSVDKTSPLHKAQVITYLRLIPAPLGLLINFNAERLTQGLSRLIHPRLAPAMPPSGPSGPLCPSPAP